MILYNMLGVPGAIIAVLIVLAIVGVKVMKARSGAGGSTNRQSQQYGSDRRYSDDQQPRR